MSVDVRPVALRMQQSLSSSRTTVPARRHVLASAVLLALGGTLAAQTPPATVPPGWYSGDTHAHIQLCGQTVALKPAQVYQVLTTKHLNVACVQVWATYMLDPAIFLALYAPLVTGSEHPVSAGDPDAIVQFGVEVSGFKASQFGHVQALDIQNGAFPTAALHTAPILAFFRAQPGAVTGYAHVLWSKTYAPASIGGGGGAGAPFMAPIDAALGAVDFVEARRVLEPGSLSWKGLYYKLLNAGLRVALVGGSDNSCVTQQIGDTRTWARISEGPLTFTRWCSAVAARATSVSDGSALFLDMRVAEAPIGSELSLAAPGVLPVQVTLHVSAGTGATGTMSLLRNGAQVAFRPYDLPAGGTAILNVALPFSQSAWVAASADAGTFRGAHTGATFVSVGDRPIATVEDTAYWRNYCDDFVAQLGSFAVPSAEPEILARVAAARKVYSALEAVTQPPPLGVVRYGHSTPACHGPIAIGVASPPSTSFLLTCINAPPDATGTLVLGLAADTVGSTSFGVDCFVDLSAPYSLLPVHSNSGGYVDLPIQLPSGMIVACQFVWANTAGCDNGGPVSASDAFKIRIP
jgi:hypothetical protein